MNSDKSFFSFALIESVAPVLEQLNGKFSERQFLRRFLFLFLYVVWVDIARFSFLYVNACVRADWIDCGAPTLIGAYFSNRVSKFGARGEKF